MPRTASLSLNDQTFNVAFTKLDRKKIYGWTKTEVFDDQDQLCALATIADGQHILPSGSVAMASFNDRGEYVSKSSLIGLDDKGKKVEKVPSIFDAPAILKAIDLDEYLSLNVKSVYQLTLSEGKEVLIEILNSGEIFHFMFNYRSDYEADDAYLISNEDAIFAVVGKKANLEYIGLDNKEEELPEEPEIVDEDDFDFGML
tara:strand:- start:3905 stop:4507 length:603 start_codon:yes stop_codon:yes gene_type:complete